MSSINQTFQKFSGKVKTIIADVRLYVRDLTGKKAGKKQPSAEEPDEIKSSSTARIASPRSAKTRPIRRRGRQKVYRLKGYTTLAKVNHKRLAERQQRLLRRALLFIIVIVSVILMYNYINPFKNIAEFYRFIGISSLSEIITGKTNSTMTIVTTEPVSSSSELETTDESADITNP